MTTPDVRTASEEAAARAKQAHGGVPSGDNDPAATDHLKAVAAAVDVLVPRIEKPVSGEAMCAGWGYQRPAPEPVDELGDAWREAALAPSGLDGASTGLARLVRRRGPKGYR